MPALTLTAAELHNLLADPAASEVVSPVGGAGLVVVRVDDERDLRLLPDGAPGAALPCVLVVIASDPQLAPACRFADVILTGAGADSAGALEPITQTVEANPIAATTLALLLRSAPEHRVTDQVGPDGAVAAGLVAESGCYSTLLAGAEFAQWRDRHPIRPPSPRTARVRTERYGDVLDVVLSRPERRNALDAAMRDALTDALAVALVDEALTVHISGAGPAFCAGGDLDEFGSFDDPARAHVTRLTRSVGWSVHRLAARTRVQVHGACMGSGIEIAAFAGAVVAAQDTMIGLPEVSMGLIPGAGGTVSLPRRIGRHRTAFLGLSALRIDAATSLHWGLVDSVYD